MPIAQRSASRGPWRLSRPRWSTRLDCVAVERQRNMRTSDSVRAPARCCACSAYISGTRPCPPREHTTMERGVPYRQSVRWCVSQGLGAWHCSGGSPSSACPPAHHYGAWCATQVICVLKRLQWLGSVALLRAKPKQCCLVQHTTVRRGVPHKTLSASSMSTPL